MKENNKRLDFGSRIFLDTGGIEGDANANSSSFTYYWDNKWSAPMMPHSGVYQLKKHKDQNFDKYSKWVTKTEYGNHIQSRLETSTKDEHDRIEYTMPEWKKTNCYREDGNEMEVYYKIGGEWGEYVDVSKMNISYIDGEGRKDDMFRYLSESKTGGVINTNDRAVWRKFLIDKGDSFVLNFDALNVEDLDYYITSRIHRKGYMRKLPILIGLRNALMVELKEEEEFIDAYSRTLATDLGLTIDQCLLGLREGVDTWKTKLKWKRPIPSTEPKTIATIKLNAMRFLKKKHKLKIDVSGNSKGKILISTYQDHEVKVLFVAHNMNKKQFLTECTNNSYAISREKMGMFGRRYGGHIYENITKSGLNKNCVTSADEKHKKMMKIHGGLVVIITKLSNKEELILTYEVKKSES